MVDARGNNMDPQQQQYNLTFTLEQVNEIVTCMQSGPFNLVTKYLGEFRRQIQAQEKKDDAQPLAPPANGGEAPRPEQRQ